MTPISTRPAALATVPTPPESQARARGLSAEERQARIDRAIDATFVSQAETLKALAKL